VLGAVALVAACGDEKPRTRPAVSTPDAQQGIQYGQPETAPAATAPAATAPTGTTEFETRGCQGCPPGVVTPEAKALKHGVQRIAFTRATAVSRADIWIAAADGSGEIRVTREPGLEMSPAWSPDGKRIAFVSDRAGGNLDLYTVRDDGTDLVRLTTSPGDEFSPAWSPDGKTIAVTRSADQRADIVLVPVAGGAERVLTRGQWASWMPDSRELLLTEGPFTNGTLALIDTVTEKVRQIPLKVPNAHQGSLSPDGRTVIFSVSDNGFSGVPSDWNEELWTADVANGDGLKRLTTRSGNDHWPVSWSPDGSQVVWTADDTEGGADLYVARSDATGVRRLTSDPGYDAWPAWAPTPQP
jgi:TolB protein